MALMLFVAFGSFCLGAAIFFVLGITYGVREEQANEAERQAQAKVSINPYVRGMSR